jgi:hypothetical protein
MIGSSSSNGTVTVWRYRPEAMPEADVGGIRHWNMPSEGIPPSGVGPTPEAVSSTAKKSRTCCRKVAIRRLSIGVATVEDAIEDVRAKARGSLDSNVDSFDNVQHRGHHMLGSFDGDEMAPGADGVGAAARRPTEYLGVRL